MYLAELETKDTTEGITFASFLHLILSIWRDGQLHTSIYDNRDDFNFYITNFPFMSIIPFSLSYDVFISQLFYDTHGLAPRMNVNSESQTSFQ